MALKANDRPWYGKAEWRHYMRHNAGSTYVPDHYNYICSMEKIRELTDSETYFKAVYEEIENELVGAVCNRKQSD